MNILVARVFAQFSAGDCLCFTGSIGYFEIICVYIYSVIMAPRKTKNSDENKEEMTKRVMQECLRDPAMLQLLKDSVREAIVSELKTTIDRNTEVIKQLELSLQERDTKIMKLEQLLCEKTDSLEQYQRRQCLRIFGIPEMDAEDTDKIAIDVASKIGIKLETCDIDRSHRVGRKADRPRPVIVKFVSYRKRREVFQNKKQLKGSGVTIREDLTQMRYKLLKECITKYGVTNVWTIDGAIHVKEGDNKRIILRASEI